MERLGHLTSLSPKDALPVLAARSASGSLALLSVPLSPLH